MDMLYWITKLTNIITMDVSEKQGQIHALCLTNLDMQVDLKSNNKYIACSLTALPQQCDYILSTKHKCNWVVMQGSTFYTASCSFPFFFFFAFYSVVGFSSWSTTLIMCVDLCVLAHTTPKYWHFILALLKNIIISHLWWLIDKDVHSSCTINDRKSGITQSIMEYVMGLT